MASSEAAEWEAVEPGATVTEEVTMERGQEKVARAKEGLPEEYPATTMAKGPSPVPDVSLAQRTSSSLSRHYAKLFSARAIQMSMGAPAPDQLNCGNHPFFEGLLPMSVDMQPSYNRVLSIKGNIFEACTMSLPSLKMTILKRLWNAASALVR